MNYPAAELRGNSLVSAGHFVIPGAWIYLGMIFVFSIESVIIGWKVIPDLDNQRGGIHEGTKTWDKVFVATYFPFILIVLPVIAGLDIERFNWSTLRTPYTILVVVIYMIASFITLWAMIENTFLNELCAFRMTEITR